MRQSHLILRLTLILGTTAGVVAAQSPEDKGLAIAREADRRDMGFGDVTADMQMVLMNKHGQKSKRKIRLRTLEVIGDGDKSLMIFDTPRDIKGTAFLSYMHKVDDEE